MTATASASDAPVILFVCLGNICRSPMAEAALVAAAAERGVACEVRSAGTGAWHVGELPDARMRRAASAVGLELRGRAAQVDPDALREADLVLAMDRRNLADLRQLALAEDLDVPIRLFRDFDPERRGADADDLDVPDPYHGGEDGFERVVAMCQRTAAHIVEELAAGSPETSAQRRP